jgi:hypothetical protein
MIGWIFAERHSAEHAPEKIMPNNEIERGDGLEESRRVGARISLSPTDFAYAPQWSE